MRERLAQHCTLVTVVRPGCLELKRWLPEGCVIFVFPSTVPPHVLFLSLIFPLPNSVAESKADTGRGVKRLLATPSDTQMLHSPLRKQ